MVKPSIPADYTVSRMTTGMTASTTSAGRNPMAISESTETAAVAPSSEPRSSLTFRFAV
jgi:hypothetical protein